MNLIDKYLFGLGYEDDSELIEPGQKLQIKIPFEFDNKQINICPFIVPYYTKKSYLDVELKANLTDRIPQDELDFRMKCLIKNIQFDKPGRLGEMGWEAEYITDPSLFTASERARIAVSSFKKFRKLILKGDWLDGIKSQPGDIIVSHPLGIKFDQGFTEDSEREGTFQRSVLSKKVFRFGEVKEDGMQYAIIGDDLDMHPI